MESQYRRITRAAFLAAVVFCASFFALAPSSAFVPELLYKKAVFAGGCFWCMQPPYDKTEGVIQTVVGYAGGKTENPTYEEVSSGESGHYEVIEVTYNPKKVTYEQLLDIFWKNIDPLNADGQFCDTGRQYRTAIFYDGELQREAAEKSKAALEEKTRRSFATQILPSAPFWPAEEYHQKYSEKNPVRYKIYREQCQRDDRLEEVWGADK